MKIKSAVLVSLGIAACSLVAHAEEDSYLYWMMDNTETKYAFDHARIGIVNSGGTEYLTTIDVTGEAYVSASSGVKSFIEVYTQIGSAYARDGYTYVLELLNGTGADPTGWEVAYSGSVAWRKDLLVTAGSLNVTPTQISVAPVPEPSGGLLLLLGVAVLGLRRRRSRNAVLALALCASFAAQAAYDDTMICFSTPGPDKYADGTQVLDGERYALVWSEDGAFDGFQANGLPVDAKDEVLAIVPFAKDGRCEPAAYAMSSAAFKRGGVLALWLLDTRVYAANGSVSFAPAEGKTKVAAVSAAAKVTADIKVEAGLAGQPAPLEKASAPTATAVPAEAPQPVINGIRVDAQAGLVYLKVGNTVPYLTYGVSAGADPAHLAEGAAKNPVTGGGEITLVVEQDSDKGARFFSVGRKK